MQLITHMILMIGMTLLCFFSGANGIIGFESDYQNVVEFEMISGKKTNLLEGKVKRVCPVNAVK